MYMYRLKHRLMLYLIYYPSVYYLWCFGDFEKKLSENFEENKWKLKTNYLLLLFVLYLYSVLQYAN